MDHPERKLLREDWLEATAETPDPDVELPEEDAMEAVRLAHQSGWRLLRQEPGLAFWVVGADMLSSALRILPILVLLMGMVAISAGHDPTTQAGLLAWGVGVVRWLLQPATILGTVGMIAAVLATGWVLSVATTTGVLGALRHRLFARTFIRQGMFFKHFGAGFTRLMWWDALRNAVVVACALLTWLGITGSLRLLVASAPHGHWATPGGGLVVAGVVAVLLTLGAVACAVCAGFFHLAQGPMVIRDRTVGEALAEAVELVRQRPYEVLILYILVAILFGVVLCIYAPFYGAAVMLAGQPATEGVASMVQLGADMFLLIGMSAASVWARGSVLSYVAMRDGLLVQLPPVPKPKRKAAEKEAATPQAQGAANPDAPAPRLVTLLPKSYPNVFDFAEASVGVGVASGHAPKLAPAAERDGGLGDAEDDVGADERRHDDAGVELQAGEHGHDERDHQEDHSLPADAHLLERAEADVGDHQPRQDAGQDGDAASGAGLEGPGHRGVGEDDRDE